MLTALFGLGAMLLSPKLQADDAHYQNFAVGARGAMLGGAFTAISDDSSGLYYNPAGIVDVSRANLSISTSLYGFERQLAFADDLGSGRWLDEFNKHPISGSEINIIPAASGVAWAFGRQVPDGSFPHGIAAGLVVPSYRGSQLQNRSFQNGLDILTNSRVSDRSMMASLGYAYRVGPWLRIGLALHNTLRLVQISEDVTLNQTHPPEGVDAAYLSSSSVLSLSNVSSSLGLGIKLHPGRRWLIGLSLNSASLSVFQRGTFDVRSTRANFASSDPNAPLTAIDTDSSRVRYDGSIWPVSMRAGLAYVRNNDYTLALDLSLNTATHYELVADRCEQDGIKDFTPLCQLAQLDRPTLEHLSSTVYRRSPIPVDVDRELTTNINIGAEKLLNGKTSLSIGAFTDFSSAPEYRVDDAGFLLADSTRISQVDHIGLTLSGGYFGSNSLSRLGLVAVLGYGQKARLTSPGAQVLDGAELRFRPVNSQELLFYVFWSSTFRYGEGRTHASNSEMAP